MNERELKKGSAIPSVREDVEQLDLSYVTSGSANYCDYLEKLCVSIY